jgi:hypothetical protein
MLWILRRIHVAIMRPVAHREWYRSGPSTIRGAGLQGRKPTIHLNGIGSAAFSPVGQRLRGAVSPRACVALGSVEQRLVKRSPPQRRAWRLARSDSRSEQRCRRSDVRGVRPDRSAAVSNGIAAGVRGAWLGRTAVGEAVSAAATCVAFGQIGQRLRGAVSPRACVALGSVGQRLGEAVSPQRRAWRSARSDRRSKQRCRRRRAWRSARSDRRYEKRFPSLSALFHSRHTT